MFHQLIVKNIATKEDWQKFKSILASKNISISDYFRNIVKEVIDE